MSKIDTTGWNTVLTPMGGGKFQWTMSVKNKVIASGTIVDSYKECQDQKLLAEAVFIEVAKKNKRLT